MISQEHASTLLLIRNCLIKAKPSPFPLFLMPLLVSVMLLQLGATVGFCNALELQITILIK